MSEGKLHYIFIYLLHYICTIFTLHGLQSSATSGKPPNRLHNKTHLKSTRKFQASKLYLKHPNNVWEYKPCVPS